MKDLKRSVGGVSASRLVLISCGSIFVSEMLVMVLLDTLPPLSRWGGALLDSILLSILVFPVLYFFVFRPLMDQIPERQRAEALLREAELRYRTLFEQSPVGVVTVDLQSGLPVEFNDLAARQLGYSREEFARLRIGDYEASETPEQTRARIERLRREGADQFETRHRTKTGEIRDVLVTVHAMKLNGQVLANCVFQDITERKEAEEAQARRVEEMAQFNAAAVGRELRMIELKQQVNGLARQLGQPQPYALESLDEASPLTADGAASGMTGNPESQTAKARRSA